ncbi:MULTISPECIES: phage tail sheath subtilisin-like domain-containing protein [unclassified Rhizobium]|uniref:phage tail sheath subtilisin-like domain-containing protein n=1 Tax=unclassified Rhizobium TaxID=2613769 RepID=UPI001780CC53|nr:MULTISPECIES: phage tail sheath subtilisin-like domain-containing protein [unclassified Rhizobium]MBD8686573.1 phage tail sheath subtilisin-like domain-containing protein [Rhizobium sp. CFBP 13644]MBD8691625.1 phage tail sheath subtilisin-like domain-containing protein [Rhizobium sp. CFBP 13717]
MDFNEIPYDWLEPATLLEIKPNYRNTGVLPYPTRALIVGQKLANGALQAGQLVEVTRAEEGSALFGLGSVGAEMVAAFRNANRTTPLFVTALADDAGAVKATGTITFAGAIPQATVLRFKIAGRPIRFTALTTDNVAAMATKLAAAINADTANAVTAAAAAGVVTCTARNGGDVGNDIDLRVHTEAQPVPNGLSVTVTAMANGVGNPALQPVLDLLTNTWFTHLVVPFADVTNLAALVEWLRNRYTATAKLDAHAFTAKRGTYGQLSTFGNLTNSAHLTCLGLNKSPTSSWIIAAAAAGIATFHLTNDPARQLRSLVVPGVEAPSPADQFLEEENNLLLQRGISTFDHLADGTTTISRMITTYKVSALGVADRAWLDIMVPHTLSRIRYDWQAYASLMYPRSKLVDDDAAGAFASRNDDDSDPGTAVVTPSRMHASWAARCKLYGEKVWIEDVNRTVKESIFQRSSDDKNRLESRQQIRIVGNLMVLAGSLEFQV